MYVLVTCDVCVRVFCFRGVRRVSAWRWFKAFELQRLVFFCLLVFFYRFNLVLQGLLRSYYSLLDELLYPLHLVADQADLPEDFLHLGAGHLGWMVVKAGYNCLWLV